MESKTGKLRLYVNLRRMTFGNVTLMVLILPLALSLFVLITLAYGVVSTLTSILSTIEGWLRR